MKIGIRVIAPLVVLLLLVACGRGGDEAEVTPAANAQTAAQGSGTGGNGAGGGQQGGPGGAQGFESAYLSNDYEGALSSMMQLVVGGIQLEESDNAITAEQATSLLPLWQGLAGGAVSNGEERNAVLKQIEATMTQPQMQAIAEMQLTNADMTNWAEANGIELPQGGPGGQGGSGGGRGELFATLTDEQRQELQNLSSPEERREKLQEFGIELPEGGPGGGQGGQGGGGQGGRGEGGQGGRGEGGQQRGAGGRFAPVIQSLVELLGNRAAE